MTMVHIKINLIPTSRLYIFQLRFLRFPLNDFHPQIVVNHSLERVAALLMILSPYMTKQNDVFLVFMYFQVASSQCMKNKLARVRLGLDAKPLVPLLGDGELHSLALRQRDERLVALEKKKIV